MGAYSEIDAFFDFLPANKRVSMTQLEQTGNNAKKSKKEWGSRKDIFNMGKAINEMDWFPNPKRIQSATGQINSWFGYNLKRTDRRTAFVVTARKKLVEKKISKTDLEELLEKNPDRVVTKNEIYALHFDIHEIEDKDVVTFIDDNTLFGVIDRFDTYKIFYEQGTDKHREIAERYGKITTYIHHFVRTFEMHHEFLLYPKSLKYRTKKYKNAKTVYLGTACSIRRERKQEKVLEISHCFTEIDHYKIEKYKHLSSRELLPLILEKLKESGFPQPTDVTFSRGLQLVWKISPLGAYRRRSWITVQRKIHEILEEFGADSAVITDTVRLLRLVGSIHEKTEEKILGLNYTNDRYDFEDLMRNTCKEEYQRLLRQREYAKNKQKEHLSKGFELIKGNKSPIQITANSSDKLTAEHRRYNLIHAKRLFDLELLISIRAGQMEGMREIACFLARYWSLCTTGNTVKAINKMKDIFESLDIYGAYEFDEIITLTSSAETAWKRWKKDYSKGYNYSQNRLVELLNITQDEMQQLTHIMSSEESQKRKKIRDLKQKRRKRNSIANEELEAAIRNEIENNPDLGATKIAEIVREKKGKCSKTKVLEMKKNMA